MLFLYALLPVCVPVPFVAHAPVVVAVHVRALVHVVAGLHEVVPAARWLRVSGPQTSALQLMAATC